MGQSLIIQLEPLARDSGLLNKSLAIYFARVLPHVTGQYRWSLTAFIEYIDKITGDPDHAYSGTAKVFN